MKKTVFRILAVLLCLVCASGLADGAAVTVYGANGAEQRTDGILCGADQAVHCYAGPSTAYDYLGTWEADGNTVIRALTLTADSGNGFWVLAEIRQGSISRVYGYIRSAELNIPDPGTLIREGSLYDLMYMQCVSASQNVTCRIGPGKEFSASPMQFGTLQGTILLTANGYALVEAWSDNAGPARVWVRTSDLYY